MRFFFTLTLFGLVSVRVFCSRNGDGAVEFNILSPVIERRRVSSVSIQITRN